MKMALAFALIVVAIPATMHADDFSSPVSTGISVGGTPQRQGVGAALLNGSNYVYYSSTDGYLSIAKDTGGNLAFGNLGRVTAPQGNIATSLNPAATSLNGIIYVAYIANNAAYVTYSSNGTSFSSPVNIPVPGSPKIDGEVTLTSGPNGLYLGLHNGSNQTVIVCSTTLSFAANCYLTSQGSTYAPGVGLISGVGTLVVSAQSNNSSHTLLYATSGVGSNGQISTGAPSFLATGGASDQTSMQPSVTVKEANGVSNGSAYYSSFTTFSFRSNDGSGHFLFKSLQQSNTSTGSWTQTHDSTYAMSGSPDLIISSGAVNFYVYNGVLMYTKTPSIPA